MLISIQALQKQKPLPLLIATENQLFSFHSHQWMFSKVLSFITLKQISAQKKSLNSKRQALSQINGFPPACQALFQKTDSKPQESKVSELWHKHYFVENLQVMAHNIKHVFQIPLGILTPSQ